jgi:hypothetical protein
LDDHAEAEFPGLMDELAAQLPDGHPVGLFERTSARDAIGQEEQAVVLYRQALDAGLPEGRRRRAVIQLASSLRNIGDAAGGAALLKAERAAVADELDDAVSAFLRCAWRTPGPSARRSRSCWPRCPRTCPATSAR